MLNDGSGIHTESSANGASTDYDDIASEYSTKALTEAGTVQGAAALLEQWARADRDLRDVLTEPWLARACYQSVVRRQLHNRAAVWQGRKTAGPVNGSSDASILALARRTLLDFPMHSGIKLGDAKKYDLQRDAVDYGLPGVDMLTKAVWLRMIADGMEDGVKVSSVYTHDTLLTLQKKAEKRTASLKKNFAEVQR